MESNSMSKDRKLSVFSLILFMMISLSHLFTSVLAIEIEKVPNSKSFSQLLSTANTRGSVRVIVQLKTSISALARGADLSPFQTKTIRESQEKFRKSIAPSSLAEIKREYQTIPAVAMKVDAESLQEIKNDPNVLSIQEDYLYHVNLMNSTPLIGGNIVHTAGYTGNGQTVAIIDTGVDINHPFFAGRVVEGACYSANLCPNGLTSSTTLASGLNCSTTRINHKCSHGTHVAGIAAGKGVDIVGVAPDAKIIAIQVFSAHSCQTSNTGLCIGAHTSDIIAGLERVYKLKDSYNIASVNMSLGGGQHFSTCDNDNTIMVNIINNLRNAGIATIISSGNEYFTGSTGSPGCISSAITVGSTTSAQTRRYFGDQESDFSNAASWVDLFAPGQLILSSVPKGGYAQKQGTSMAAPQVAGAWAVMKSKNTNASVSAVESALKSTGKAIATRSGGSKPRIDLSAALNKFSNTSSLPKKAILIAPEGEVFDSTPTFTWNAVSNASEYALYVNDSVTKGKISEWYTSDLLGCETGICSLTPTITLANGKGTWWIKTKNSSGEGDWSLAKDFTITQTSSVLPSAAILISPTGSINDNAPTYRWNTVSDATWYYVYVNDSATKGKIAKWYTAESLGCNTAANCSLSELVTLAEGNAEWWVKTWNEAGEGPWSSSQIFTVKSVTTGSNALGKVTLLSPNGVINTSNPTYTWKSATNATWYYVYIEDSAGVFADWVSSEFATCNSGTCSVRASYTLTKGDVTWWVMPWNTASGYGSWSLAKTFTVK
jgi:subtilisin family serine protease